MYELPVVSLPHVPNPAAFLAPPMAALIDVRRVQPYVCAGIQATGRSELAGRSFLDDPAACDRGKTGTQFDQVVLNFYLLRGVCVSDLGSGTGGGYYLQPAGNGGLENYGERRQHRETARSLHNLRLRAGRPYGGGSAEPPENSFCVDRDQRRIVPRTAERKSAEHPGRCQAPRRAAVRRNRAGARSVHCDRQ